MAKILLAEDERQIADMISFKLTNSGHQVVRAQDGEQAVTLAARERPDLILLDTMMPGLSGFEVLRCLKRDSAARSIPVIMVTAKAMSVTSWPASGAEPLITSSSHSV